MTLSQSIQVSDVGDHRLDRGVPHKEPLTHRASAPAPASPPCSQLCGGTCPPLPREKLRETFVWPFGHTNHSSAPPCDARGQGRLVEVEVHSRRFSVGAHELNKIASAIWTDNEVSDGAGQLSLVGAGTTGTTELFSAALEPAWSQCRSEKRNRGE